MRWTAIILFLTCMSVVGQTVYKNPICYGEPIELQCSFVTGGCGNISSTFHWQNFSGSWQSYKQNNTIVPGATGYQSDRFYLSVQYAPPHGGFSGGLVTVVLRKPITVSYVTTPSACEGINNGSITLEVTGRTGTPPLYRFLWNDGATTQNRTDLGPGTYWVLVTALANMPTGECTQNFTTYDGVTINNREFNCDSTEIYITPSYITVGSLSNLDATVTTVDETCAETLPGSAEAMPSGGLPPYTYQWSNGQTTKKIENLSGGVYTVTITDDNGCYIVRSGTVGTQVSDFNVLYAIKELRCNVNGSGAIYLYPDEGGNYNYLWNDGNTDRVRLGLNAGNYSVTVTNHCGVSVIKNDIEIKSP